MLMIRKNPRTAAQSPLAAMARAALSVVFSQERDEEIAALRARMVEMQRRHEEELFDVRWRERLELARVMYRNERNDGTDDADETMVMRYLVH